MKTATYEPQKIVSITTRNNINLLPLTCGYVENLVKGIGMPEEKVKTIRILTENVLKRRMINAICEAGKHLPISGIFAMPVAFHPISQKILDKEGFIPTGVLLHYVTPESTGAYADGDRRLDVFLCAKLFKPSSDLKLSLPEKHRLFAEQLYQSMGAGCSFLPAAKLSGEAAFTMHSDKEIGVGQLLVDNAPADFDNDLDAMMKDFTKNGIAMAEAYVNMHNPSAEAVYRMLEERGFFFSGILPGRIHDSAAYYGKSGRMGEDHSY